MIVSEFEVCFAEVAQLSDRIWNDSSTVGCNVVKFCERLIM